MRQGAKDEGKVLRMGVPRIIIVWTSSDSDDDIDHIIQRITNRTWEEQAKSHYVYNISSLDDKVSYKELLVI